MHYNKENGRITLVHFKNLNGKTKFAVWALNEYSSIKINTIQKKKNNKYNFKYTFILIIKKILLDAFYLLK